MTYLFTVSGENPELAAFEIEQLLHPKHLLRRGRFVFGDVAKKEEQLFSRLAFTHSVYEFLFTVPLRQLEDHMEKVDWKKHVEGSFCLRLYGKPYTNPETFTESYLAGFVWRSLEKPSVDLEHPTTTLALFVVRNKVYCGRLHTSLDHDFEKRKAHHRPALHPTALHPRMARCLVNLSGITTGLVTDPFCGSAGILIEAGLMGLKVRGYDLYQEMLDRAKANLDFFHLKGYTLACNDALHLSDTLEYVVSDVPYGMNSSVWVSTASGNTKLSLKQDEPRGRIRNLKDFYLAFLVNLHKIVGKRAVLIFPHYAKAKMLLDKSGFTIKGSFKQRIHRSLTREIFVVEP
ncbi:MAG: THUMP domain-containing protein [Nanoarchaeota archaeon]|nr:THUMP domain-containing protein [Nanoarchaeota archaeon]